MLYRYRYVEDTKTFPSPFRLPILCLPSRLDNALYVHLRMILTTHQAKLYVGLEVETKV